MGQPFVIPLTLCNAVAANAGQDLAVTNVEATVAIPNGLYKICAEGSGIRWRLGATAVTATTGSLLPENDSEIIYLPGTKGANTTIRAICSGAAVAGSLNIVPVELVPLTERDMRLVTTA